MMFWTKMKLTTKVIVAICLAGGMGVPIYCLSAETSQTISSKPLVQNGLQVTTTLPKATFAVEEPLKFTVQFKNVSEKPFMLYDADYFWNWRITFEDQQKMGPWRFNKLFKDQRIKPESKMLNPGESLDVTVVLDQDKQRIEFAWEGLQRKIVEPVKNLSVGNYELVIEAKLQAGPSEVKPDVTFWTGPIKTNSVAFNITGK